MPSLAPEIRVRIVCERALPASCGGPRAHTVRTRFMDDAANLDECHARAWDDAAQLDAVLGTYDAVQRTEDDVQRTS